MKNDLKKWGPLGISIITIFIIWAWYNFPSTSPYVPYDPFNGVAPDIGEYIGDANRPAMWTARSISLGKTDFVAVAGPNKYDDNTDKGWDFYTLSVEKKDEDGSSIFYQRWIRKKDVPDDFWEKKVEEFTSYDEASRTVIFKVGESNYVCQLPEEVISSGQ